MPKSELATDPNVDGLSDYVKSIAYDFGAMAGKKKLEADTEKSKTASIGSKVGVAKESDMSYTENAALLQYKSSESYKVNAKLREGIELDEFEQQFVKNLDSALEKLPKYEGTLYRNLVFDDVGGDQEGFDSFMEVHQPGNPVFYEAFTSTATEQDGYPLEGKYVVHMVIANSKNARDVSGYGNNFENEAIYPRNATFFVDKIDYDSNATPIIYLQEDFESGEKRKYEQLHTQKRSKDVRKMQESHSEDNYLQGVSRADSNGNFRSTQALQGVSRQINVESKGQNEQFKGRNNKAAEVKVLSEQERNRVKNIANRLGRTVVFEDTKSVDGKFSDGYLDKNGVIHIDYSCIDPVNFVLKHELTHFTERSEKYKDFFKKTVESKAFEKWINRQIPGNKGIAAKKGEYRQQIKDRYAKRGIELSNTKLDAEMLANFVGEVLFDENGSGLESIVSDMNVRERSSFVQLIKDFITYIKRRLAGKDVPFEIIRLERLFNETLSSAGNKNTAEDGGGVRYSLNKDFSAKYDQWDKNRIGFRFLIGTTSKELTSIGANEKPIYWDAGKIKKILTKHPNMTDDVIKQVPNIIEDPILIMESQTVSGRLTLFGEVYDAGGHPVLAVIELNPVDKNGKSLDIIMVASAYGKDSNPQSLINNSVIRYIDPNKERTNRWLSDNGLQLPRPSSTISSSNPTIPQKGSSVNTYDMQDGGKNSLVGENVKQPAGNYNVYGKDVKYKSDDLAPVREDIDTLKRSATAEDYKAGYDFLLNGEKDANSYSISSDATDLLDRYESGEISREEYLEENRRLWEKAGEEYSTIENGEFAEMRRSEASVPKKVEDTKKVKRFVRTVLETGTLTEEAVADIQRDVLLGDFSYEPISDQSAREYADREFAGGRAERRWADAVEKGFILDKKGKEHLFLAGLQL